MCRNSNVAKKDDASYNPRPCQMAKGLGTENEQGALHMHDHHFFFLLYLKKVVAETRKLAA